MNGRLTERVLPWAVSVLMAVLAFLGASLYSDQKIVSAALGENTAAIRELAAHLSGYIKMNDERHEGAKEHWQKLEEDQQRILDRLDRSGMAP